MSSWLSNPFSTSKPTRTRTTSSGSPEGQAAGEEWIKSQKERMAGGPGEYGGPNPFTGGENEWQRWQRDALGGLQTSYGEEGGWQDRYKAIGGMSPDEVAAMNRSGGPSEGYFSPYTKGLTEGVDRDLLDAMRMAGNTESDMAQQYSSGGPSSSRSGVERFGMKTKIGLEGAEMKNRIRDTGFRNAMGWQRQDYQDEMERVRRANMDTSMFNKDAMSAGQFDVNNQLNLSNAYGAYGNRLDEKNMAGMNWLKGNWDDRNARSDQWNRDLMTGIGSTPWRTESTQTGEGKSNLDKTIGYGMMAGKLYLVCIPEGTKIDTPDGPVAIEDIKAGTKVKGYYKAETEVLQVHQYKEDPKPHRFYRIAFDNGGTVDCCDMHKIYNKRAKDYKVGDRIQNTKVTSITRYNGVERSYDLLTADGGYLIGGVPVNSMIEELAELAFELKQSAEAA